VGVYAKFEYGFLTLLHAHPSQFMYYPHELSTKYNISVEHIRQLLLEWAERGFISLKAWDNTIFQERPWNEWPGPHGVFFTPWDKSAVRIRILAHGSRYLETLVNPENAAIEFKAAVGRTNRLTETYSNAGCKEVTEQLGVFLCHGSEDKMPVRELYKRLAKDGFAPWLDEENLIPGQDWQQEITKAVRMCHVVLVCLSASSVTKEGFVQKEIKIALDVADEKPEGTIFIIPVRLQEGVNVPSRLSQWQWVNLFDDGGYGQLVRALNIRSREIGTVAGRQENKHESTGQTNKGSDHFLALEQVAGQIVEELSSYRPLDRTFLTPLFEEFRRTPGQFARYPEIRACALKLQNVLDRMFVAKRDHQDDQHELRSELDSALKALLTACDQARNTSDNKNAMDRLNRDTPLWKVIELVSSQINEQRDGHYFPKSRAYIRQQALDGRLTIWGRRQLDPPKPFKEIRKFSDVLTSIPREYWAISKLSAACTTPQEYSDRIPSTLPEQSGSWAEETSAYADLYANWEQAHKLVMQDWHSPDMQFPTVCPKVRPASYGVKTEKMTGPGLVIANDGEPAYDISIPDIEVGRFKVQINPGLTRLSKEDGKHFCEVCIWNPKGTLLPGDALLNVMHSEDVGGIPFVIRFADSDGKRYVTICRLELEASMTGGINNLRVAARFIKQELEAVNMLKQ